MNFFQRIGNALSRFMYGRNGVDRLCLTMIWAALLLDIINIFLRDRQPAAYSIVGFVSTVIVFLALYRMFSRNLEKRRAETPALWRRSGIPSAAASPETSSSGWIRTIATLPAPSAARCAACRRGRAASLSPAPAAATRYTGKAEKGPPSAALIFAKQKWCSKKERHPCRCLSFL